MNNQSKVQMQPAADSASSGASQGARRATEDAPEAARRVSPSTDSEVVPVAKRKRFTNAQKRSIVIAANACTKPGDVSMRQASWMQTMLKSVALSLTPHAPNSKSWR